MLYRVESAGGDRNPDNPNRQQYQSDGGADNKMTKQTERTYSVEVDPQTGEKVWTYVSDTDNTPTYQAESAKFADGSTWNHQTNMKEYADVNALSYHDKRNLFYQSEAVEPGKYDPSQFLDKDDLETYYSHRAQQPKRPDLGYNPATVYKLVTSINQDESFQEYVSQLTPEQLNQIESNLSPEQVQVLQNVGRQFGMHSPDGLVSREGLLAAIQHYPELQETFKIQSVERPAQFIQPQHVPAMQEIVSYLSPQDQQRFANDDSVRREIYELYTNGKLDNMLRKHGRRDLTYYDL